MCGIFGRICRTPDLWLRLPRDLVKAAQARGRDSYGVAVWSAPDLLRVIGDDLDQVPRAGLPYQRWAIGNTRAEPTTEFVPAKQPTDVQPFTVGPVTVAHNGTFANDRELADQWDIPAPRGIRSDIDTARWTAVLAQRGAWAPNDVLDLLAQTKGSYALAVGHEDGWVVLAANYRPLWLRWVDPGQDSELEFTSVSPRHLSLPDRLAQGWTALPPYSALVIEADGEMRTVDLQQLSHRRRSLVVCSGGLDSSVAAAATIARQHNGNSRDVDLLHITYGCRAQVAEVEAIKRVAAHLETGLRTVDLTHVFAEIGHSRLTGTWQGAATGETGAEYAVEWVPARNTILLATALGMAEAHGYTHLVLGNNIEEAGAYPDNDTEFVERFNDLIPFAVGPDRPTPVVEQPVGRLTKREIVALGLSLDRELLAHTWSCYDNGPLHCGNCGPCFMRRTAFAMAGEPDPMPYRSEQA